MSGLAILKYIPRSFRVEQVAGMAFFTESKHDEFRNGVLRITLGNPRPWGTMNAFQTLHHLNLACGGSLVDWYPEQPVGLRLPKAFKIPPDWEPHPMFGKMTVKEWDKLLQIHIDYHLRQFAA